MKHNVYVIWIAMILLLKMVVSVCVDGETKCASECQCGEGYLTCDNDKWVKSEIPEGTVCAQNGSQVIFYSACVDDAGPCTGRISNCNCSGNCINGDRRCSSSCDCDATYEVCDNGQWILQPLAAGTICYQNGSQIIEITLTGMDKEIAQYCPKGIAGDCVEHPTYNIGDQICKSECLCSSGYFEFTEPGIWRYFSDPEGTICIQRGNYIEHVHECPEYGDIKECINRNYNCDCLPHNTPNENGNQRCIDECACGSGYEININGFWFVVHLSDDLVCVQNGTQIYTVPKCPEYGNQLGCTNRTTGNCGCAGSQKHCIVNGEEICDHECYCNFGYTLCQDGSLYHFNSPDGYVCYQHTCSSVIFLPGATANTTQQCSYVQQNGCGGINPYICTDGAQQCLSECSCDYGYRSCSNNQWVYMPMPNGTVCKQNGTTIMELPSCPEYGDQGQCTGQVTGNCGCDPVKEYEPGQYRCINECDCHGHYQVCDNFHWKVMDLPPGTVCQQNGTSILLVHSCPEFGDQGTCSGHTANCNCNKECVEGIQTCIDECACGVGYTVCRNGRYQTIPIHVNEICEYNPISRRTNIINYYDDSLGSCRSRMHGNCNVDPDIDYILRCKDSGRKGVGYYVYDPNNGYTKSYYHIKHQLVCIQLTYKTIEIKLYRHDHHHSHDSHLLGKFCLDECKLGYGFKVYNEIGKFQIVYIKDNELCEQILTNDVRIHTHNIFNQVHGHCVVDYRDDTGFIDYQCYNKNGTYCYTNCTNDYYSCTNGNLYEMTTAPGTVCYQETVNSIVQLHPSDYRCNNIDTSISNNNNNFNGNNNFINFKCLHESGQYCIDECGIGKGYYACSNYVPTFMSVPTGNVCWQYRTDSIQLVHSDPKMGDTYDCKDRIH